jgi:hypothetical protein
MSWKAYRVKCIYLKEIPYGTFLYFYTWYLCEQGPRCKGIEISSVADPGCLTSDPGSRILIFTHPGSRIPDPKTAMKDIGEKKFVFIPFFWSHKFHKIELFYF